MCRTSLPRRWKVRTSAHIVFEYLSKTTALYDRTASRHYLALGVRDCGYRSGERTIEVRHSIAPARQAVGRMGSHSRWPRSAASPAFCVRVSVDKLLEGLVWV